jgi:hypothetical protein
MRRLASVLILLAVVGLGLAGEKDIVGRLEQAGARIVRVDHEDRVAEVDLSAGLDPDARLAELCELRRLRHVKWCGKGMTDLRLRTLGELRGLKRLTLDNTAITDAGLADLAGLSALAYLSLDGSAGVTDVGIDGLARLKNLSWVKLTGTGVTEEGAGRLRRALPDCRVILVKP